MVNSPSQTAAPERRERPRTGADHAPALGASNLNPFGDLVALQHLSARLAKGLKPMLEGLMRRELRCWAEPLEVARFSDYRASRGEGLTAWQPLAMEPGRARALIVIDGKLVLEMLDAFFGGEGEAPSPMPEEFTTSAETMVARIARGMIAPLGTAWEPVSRISFAEVADANCASAPDLGEAAVVVTRFGFAVGEAAPVHFDLIYPMAGLKPHGSKLTAKVQSAQADVAPQWRTELTRAVMSVKLPVRSVLAEPMITLGRLMELKTGDIIPIEFGPEAPVMVGDRRLGTGQVGTSGGHAAVRLTSLEDIQEGDFQ
ncbi:flagellar motor switch protein FliM [Stakelama tenebrarum]|uniref:Flagellar motor switch protein FliM n=1 Tax=Stakelama tenebrarum TaxID=2711215 RepID=A0A6G6Y1P0_9SPHN|nr:FliM/FliN family flagellar motor switch protein [Sphingosinithalassobacter tenebrarum]QIG78727.1 flagellar motor switch protein FliM [Sphingosinithalassobacter tenebrarum]